MNDQGSGGRTNGDAADGGPRRRTLPGGRPLSSAFPPPAAATGAAPAGRAPAPPAPAPPKRFNAIGIVLAFVIAAVLLPYTMRFQRDRFGPITKKAYRMTGLDGITEMQAVSRFGTPLVKHDFQMSEGVVAGPEVGQKRYYPLRSPDLAEHLKDAETVWKYPQYSTVREMIWKLPDSFLTIWFHEPRAEIDLGATGPDGSASITLPDTSHGDWEAIDNFRLGNDLVREKKGPEPGRTP